MHDGAMTQDRWDEVMALLVEAVPAGGVTVVVDGTDARTGPAADRLAAALRSAGRPCTRLPSGAGLRPSGNRRRFDGFYGWRRFARRRRFDGFYVAPLRMPRLFDVFYGWRPSDVVDALDGFTVGALRMPATLSRSAMRWWSLTGPICGSTRPAGAGTS